MRGGLLSDNYDMACVDHLCATFQPLRKGSGTRCYGCFSNLLRTDNGNAMIELSLILPVIILLLLGMLDIAVILQKAMIVADTARIGAEYGAANWNYASNTGDMQGLAGYIGNYGVTNYSAVAAISCTCGPGGGAVSCSGTCTGGVSPVQYAQVTTTATVPLLFGVRGLPGTIPLKSVVKVRVAWRGGN